MPEEKADAAQVIGDLLDFGSEPKQSELQSLAATGKNPFDLAGSLPSGHSPAIMNPQSKSLSDPQNAFQDKKFAQNQPGSMPASSLLDFGDDMDADLASDDDEPRVQAANAEQQMTMLRNMSAGQ